jgi:hypothetical protein
MADEFIMDALGVFHLGWSRLADSRGGTEIVPLGEGHINDTLLVSMGGRPRFVLQRINRQVFPDPERLMTNLAQVLGHLDATAPGTSASLEPTDEGTAALVVDGEWWRLWRYVSDSRSLSETRDPAVALAAGAAFGSFQRIMRDLPGPELVPCIPGFMELEGYLCALDDAVAVDPDRADSAVSLSFIEDRRTLGGRFPPADNIVHGDCKLNNLLFARSEDRVVSVLDLDTVMHGHWAWDFGDLARSLLSPHAAIVMADGPENERSMMDLFGAVVAGFCSAARVTPSTADLVAAPIHVAFMLGVRFLTDHLQGDRYFKVGAHGDNQVRAGRQFELVRRLEGVSGTLTETAEKSMASLLEQPGSMA